MAFYAVLLIATIASALLSVAVWRKTRQVAFLVGFAFLYYWSLYGGWLVVNRGMGSSRTYRFEYMYYRLFPVYLDDYYLWALILYSLFVVIIQVTVLAVARRPLRAEDAPPLRIVVSHGVLLWVCALLAAGAYGLAWGAIGLAMSMGTSAYGALSVPGLVPMGTVYQILHQSGLTFALMGAVVLLCGRDARYIVGRPTRVGVLGYAVVLAALGGLSVVMGNRSMLVFASAGAGLFYLVNARRPSRLLIVSALVAAAASLSLQGIIRGASGQRELGSESLFGKVRYVVTDALSQDVEAFAAHASMYGTLQKHVPFTYGSSLLWLATSVIPAVVRPELVPIAYNHYAEHVGAAYDQGFTLHHATGWYLNFGVPGLVAGAVLFGWLWARLFNAFCAMAHGGSHFRRVFATTAFWAFTGYTPMLIRSGPEGYKGATVEALLIPALLMFLASLTVVREANRLRLAPRRQAPDPPRMNFDPGLTIGSHA